MSLSSTEPIVVRTPQENCARIKKLGYIAGKQVNLYGERIKLVSDPFEDGNCVAVRAVSGGNPTVRTFDLPMTLLSGWHELIPEVAEPAA